MMATRGYEALIILKATGAEQDLAREASRLEDPIKKVGGRVETAQPMGRRKLAFKIARHTEGSYHLLRFQAPPDQIGEVERLFRLDEAIVRFMILNAEEAAPLSASSARQTASQSALPSRTGYVGPPRQPGGSLPQHATSQPRS